MLSVSPWGTALCIRMIHAMKYRAPPFCAPQTQPIPTNAKPKMRSCFCHVACVLFARADG